MDLEWGDEIEPNTIVGDETVNESSGEAESVDIDATLVRMIATPDSVDVEAINEGGGRNKKLPPMDGGLC